MSEMSYVVKYDRPDDFRVMNQTAVKQAITDEPLHNACWDAKLAFERLVVKKGMSHWRHKDILVLTQSG